MEQLSKCAVACSRLVPKVAEFRSGHFRLGPELRRLLGVREVGAIEAIVFYGARVLEALTAEALTAVKIEASVNVFSNLQTLEQYSLLTAGALHSAHALRRLGNAARHIQEELNSDHAQLALALTEQTLAWFFLLDLPKKPRLERLCENESSLALATDESLRGAMANAEKLGRTWHSGWPALRIEQGPALLRTGQTAAIIAELWINHGEEADLAAAGELLGDALKRHPDNLRLQQLRMLHASRSGDLAAASKMIDDLMDRNSDDDETVGIAAGVYKRMWKQDPAARNWLAKSHKLYLTGWKKSKGQNAYLGINAATTSLLLGRAEESWKLAAEIEQLLTGRNDRLRECGCSSIEPDYWTQVSLAESLLLEGKLDEAATAYHAAFQRFSCDRGNIRVTISQMHAIAEARGLSEDEFARLPKEPPPAS
ncbi:MAG TPA: tetratricopeptide repeat-containing protein [Pirellulales bacterium]|nr:tetratricopeptide repeat-containing protein [Pirellulales bacterium]